MQKFFKEHNLRETLRNNAVTVMFVIMCIICMAFSGQSVSYLMFELFNRIARNSFIVLSLIIPIIAGMGINFAITIGAMAAQVAILWTLEWRIPGIAGFIVAALMTIPIAGIFGYLIGKLLNKMKGQEMIGGMILGYFANGLYQLVFLFIFGNIIPLSNPNLVIKGSVGVANTMDLSRADGFKHALENLGMLSPQMAVIIAAGILLILAVVSYLRKKSTVRKLAVKAVIAAVLVGVTFTPFFTTSFSLVSIPVATYVLVALLCLFNVAIMKTKLGQQFRAVGQNMTVANAAGINCDRVRVIAIVISTIFAGLGQLIFVENLGSLQTYGAHEQVGLYAGAAILVGGASIVRATNGQAILGCILFHTLFIVAPAAGKNVFGDAAIGEYFRVFISYGVIALALVMHAWKKYTVKKDPEEALSRD